MTQYARVVDGSVTDFSLPESGKLSDGREVSGYNNLPEEVLFAEGWRTVYDPGPPQFDPNTQQATHKGYEFNSLTQQVEAKYSVESLPPPPPPEPDYDALFRDAVSKATTLDQLKAALIGNAGPGAQPKRGRP